MEEVKTQDDAAPGTSTEHEFRYVAAPWFLDTGISGSRATGQSQNADFPSNENLSRPVFDKGLSDSSGRPVSIINPPVGYLEKTHRRPSYTSLPTPTSIRLVKLYNFTGSKPWSMDEPIRCSLVVADLTDGPDYFALSYTWGNPRTIYTDKNDVFSAEAWASPAFEIDCDGHAVSVTTNLYTALLSMRGSFSKGAFVKKLREDRFRSNHADQARATIMWLGGEEPLIKQGVPKTKKKFLLVNKRLREVVGPGNEDLVMDRCLAFDIFDPKAFEQLGLEPVDLADLVGWYLLYSRSWFKRAWVVQKCVLSPNSLFLCGTLMFSVRTVCTMLINLARQGWALPIQDLVIANLLDPETMAIPTELEKYKRDHRDSSLKSKYFTLPLFRARLDYSILDQLDESLVAVYHLRHFLTTERSKTPPRNPSSQELWKNGLSIKNFRGRRCMDPRDKIYAFHGMFKTSDGRSIFPSPYFLKSVSEVYTEATRAILLDTGILFIHFREFRSSNPHSLPSWVPDYQVNDGFLYLHNTAIAGRDPSTFFTAAASLGASTLVFKENNKLGLVGCHVDTVVRPEPFRPEIGTMGANCRHLLETLLQIPEESLIPMPPSDVLYSIEGTATPEATKPTPEATKQSRYEVLWRTLVQDKRGDHIARHPAPSEMGDALIGCLNRLLRSQCAYIVAKDILELLEHWRQESTQSDDSQ
ncbi:hypothetical protein K456DRAFT_1931805 [Colletotrichum gloeosporioides 23]|nr:hypothetical protein K456DRAFT_1931805 [Colletotrichum gloeosporioides 23]